MKPITHTSITSLVKHIESVLKAQAQFFVSYSRMQRDPATLLSLKLVEVRRPQPKDAGFSVIVEGKFEGRDGPHEFQASAETLAACGIGALSVGMGATPNFNGTVGKCMTLHFLPSLLKGAIAAEVKAMFREKNAETKLKTLKPVKETKRYKQLVADITELDYDISSLSRARELATAKLERMLAKALEKADASALLPAKKASRPRASAQ